MTVLALGLTFLALALGAALAGLFFSFSMSVMRGLDELGPQAAASAMRSINRRILNPWLFLAFIGTPLAAAAAGVVALFSGHDALWLFLAAGVSIAGSFVVTSAINVPMNDALESGALDWAGYAPRWTAWNTVRTAASLVVVLLLGCALLTW